MPSATTIEEAIAEYKPQSSMRFVPKKDLKSKQILHATQRFSQLSHLDNIVGMMDTTLMKSGKEGFVLTQPLLHVRMLRDEQVPLDFMKSASCKDRYVTVTYKDGSTVKFYASIYDGDLCSFLNTLVKLSEQKESALAADSESKPSTEPAEKTQSTPKQEPKTSPAPAPKPEPKPISKPEPSPAPVPKAQTAPAKKTAAPGAEDFDKGTEAYRRGDKKEAFRLYKLAADAGIAPAMFNLSMLSGQNKELPAAFDWMLRSARARYIPAYSRVAQMYLKGIGTEKDYYAAQYWARRAVQNGDANAQTLLSQADGIVRDFLRSLEVGNRFEYGNYPQTEDGQLKPILWRVLDKQAEKLLVISEYVLDRQDFDSHKKGDYSSRSHVWAECTLRQWLHKEFWDTAFQEFDTARILKTQVHTESHPDYDLLTRSLPANAEKPERCTVKCPDSQDYLFLLSWNEVIRYLCGGVEPVLQSTGFCDGEKSVSATDILWYNFDGYGAAAPATPYLGKKIPKGMVPDEPQAYERFGNSDWWLRNISAREDNLYVYCGDDGHTDAALSLAGITIGGPSRTPNFTNPKPGSIRTKMQLFSAGVRPAMWLDLK